MFEEPELLDNNKRIAFKIKHDIKSDAKKITGAQLMDFRKKLYLNLKVKRIKNDIGT